MTNFIVTDIFGLTPAISTFASALQNSQVIDPYQGLLTNFANEADAYQAFLHHCGHDKYYYQVLTAITNTPNSTIIAFSAGASASFRAISEVTTNHLIAFYPSQIRHHLHLNPKSPTTIIFPHHEAHFDVAKVLNTVAECPTVCCLQSEQNHGFMNPQSQGFCQQLATPIEQLIIHHDLRHYQAFRQQLKRVIQP